jgi:very-short-patch-repair endonuclease
MLYRFDFYWEAMRTVGEADGMVKYADAQALRAEKRRQLEVEDGDREVVRWTWEEIWNKPAVVADRVFRGFERARKRFGR